MEQFGFTPGPWKFERMENFDALHKLQGTTPEPHEGYFRSNSGDWGVGFADGRVCLVDFKGKAKRGQGYQAPDPEGQANARLIAAAPEMYAALKSARNLIEELVAQAGLCMIHVGVNQRQQDWVRSEMRSYGKHLIAPIEAALSKAVLSAREDVSGGAE